MANQYDKRYHGLYKYYGRYFGCLYHSCFDSEYLVSPSSHGSYLRRQHYIQCSFGNGRS